MGDRTSVVIAGRMGQLFALIIRRSQYSKNDPQTRCSSRKGRRKGQKLGCGKRDAKGSG